MEERCVTLDDIVTTDSLCRRPERERNLRTENATLRRLMHEIPRAGAPLDTLLSAALEVCEAGSAGVSVLEPSPDGGRRFRWVSMAGALAPYVGGTTPGNFSPCGTTLARGSTQLFSYPERLYTYFAEARPEIVEALVIPFVIDEDAGTIWVVSHDPDRRFTTGDAEFMTALADFTATALSLQRGARREREARRVAEQANRTKDDFLATVCHELRTPLNSIVGWSELMAEADLTPDETEAAVSGVRAAATRQTRLVEDLLDMARIVSGGLNIERAPVDIQSVLQTVMDSIRPLAEARFIRLDVERDTSPHLLAGDAGRLQQALANVLTNAVKFTAPGGTVRVALTRDGADLAVRVSDNGIGIDAGFLPHVFERFSQADSTPGRRVGGLGLGLAIARDIVEKHGGTICAESAGRGHGASFTITLPCDQVTALSPDPLPTGATSIRDPARLDRVRILFVDDDDDAREAIGVSRRQRGADVQVAASGCEAIEILERWQPDVLLSDIAMPGGDGYEFITRVRREQAGGVQLKAAALTACTTPAERQQALRAGFDAHLSKPITGARLVASITSLLEDPATRRIRILEER